MTIHRKKKRFGWEMAPPPTRFVRNQQATACDLLFFTMFSRTLSTFFRPNHNR
ncbi:unnamed protein product [Hymenolepis diminuta]|uniref:Uncharacterized protein n=1 Tax=Hymenolepis diminuta TaxID=6216 RepID=A0A564Y477_HYMDI|nr:unnamed protein product [Hymenolepis diminuta]